MDRILYNGNFTTLDVRNPKADAVAIKEGIIVQVGSVDQILPLADANTQIINLEGKQVLPGFSDGHLHLIFYAKTKRKIDLTSVESIEELISICKKNITDQIEKNNGWILGCGWNQDYWNLSVFPTRWDLDQISRDIPIAITRACYHVTIVNSKALELIGLNDTIPILSNGRVAIDDTGEATGVLLEGAQNILWDCIPIPSVKDIKEMIVEACIDASKLGITALQTDDFEAFSGNSYELIIKAYRELADEGKLPIRIYQQCLFKNPYDLNSFLSKGYRTGQENGFYKIGPIKLLLDGSLGARTAFLKNPYKDSPQEFGMPLYSFDELYQMVKMAHQNNMQVAIHCIGDAAIEMAIKCYDKVMKNYPRIDPRHGIVHCQITDIEMINNIRALDLLVYAQPIFLRYDREIINQRVGEELGKTSYNWKAYINRGVHLNCGSDCPVEKMDIMPNIYSAVTGKNPEDPLDSAWQFDNCIGIEECIKTFTTECAFAAFQENERGTIAVGKYADFVVLEENIYDIDEEKIKDITVFMTMVNGIIVFRD